MSAARKQLAAAFASGLVFAVGLALSGMTQPSKVLGFLDFTSGAWDPSLALVMVGAIGVHALTYQLVRRRPSPLLASRWSLPTRRDIDGRLVAGAALFGLGWGLGGFCPGPGLVSLISGSASALTFAFAMAVAMSITAQVEAARQRDRESQSATARSPSR